jgi:hypothetical protein
MGEVSWTALDMNNMLMTVSAPRRNHTTEIAISYGGGQIELPISYTTLPEFPCLSPSRSSCGGSGLGGDPLVVTREWNGTPLPIGSQIRSQDLNLSSYRELYLGNVCCVGQHPQIKKRVVCWGCM